jgi:NADH-quinone oxidoreductase subunit G
MSETDTPATPDTPPKTTLSITVDGRPHEANPGQLVIDACEDAGTYVPRFCYHHRMSPVGMCRQCLVEVEGPRGPMLVVSCMTPVAEGQVVRTDTPTVKKAQEGVLEFLLANHPLDCPVCDKGGECPLQDQAFSHGPGESRFVEEKRHYEKPIPISDLVLLDRERCILCDRCTRFADEVAGDPLIHFTHRGNGTQVLTFPDEPFSSYFSGNTVQICPVGALTATPYRFKARPWDLEEQESTCTMCSVGCRVVVQSSRDELVRILGVDSDPVNWGWLCDKGRFTYEATNSDARVVSPLVREGDALEPTTWNDALDVAAAAISDALAEGGPASVAVLGGARGTNEDAFAWARLAREVIGTSHVDAQLGDGLPPEVLGLPAATIDDAARAATIVLLGPDLKEELPVLYLRVRDAAQKRRSRIVEISPAESGLTRYAWRSVRHAPGETVAALTGLLGQAEVTDQLAAGPVVAIVGRPNLAEDAAWTLAALALLRERVPGLTVLPALRRGNVRGALQAGLNPGEGGHGALGILEAAARGTIGCLVLLGADPLADCPDTDLARRALEGARRIVAVDAFLNESSSQADVVLAAAVFGEKAGTTTNLEGRVTRVAQQVTPAGTARPDWMIAAELALRLDGDLGVGRVDDLTAGLAAAVPAFAAVTPDALDAHPDGVLVSWPVGDVPAGTRTTPARNAYDFRLVASRKLYDDGVATDQSPSLRELAPGTWLYLHPLDLGRLGATEGTPLKVSTARTSLVLDAAADTGVPQGTAWVAWNQPDATIGDLIDATNPVVDVRVESLE